MRVVRVAVGHLPDSDLIGRPSSKIRHVLNETSVGWKDGVFDQDFRLRKQLLAAGLGHGFKLHQPFLERCVQRRRRRRAGGHFAQNPERELDEEARRNGTHQLGSLEPLDQLVVPRLDLGEPLKVVGRVALASNRMGGGEKALEGLWIARDGRTDRVPVVRERVPRNEILEKAAVDAGVETHGV